MWAPMPCAAQESYRARQWLTTGSASGTQAIRCVHRDGVLAELSLARACSLGWWPGRPAGIDRAAVLAPRFSRTL
jgi:hypothetical protein